MKRSFIIYEELQYNYYPIFITGPDIEYDSDRKGALIYLYKKHKLKYFYPEKLGELANKKSKISFLAQYCFNQSFMFESVLAEISLANIMFPHTGSSIYELAQFNNKHKKNNYIYVPKENSKGNKPSIPELGTYIQMNHYRNFIKYKNEVNSHPKLENSYFPKMNKKWKFKNFNILAKKIKNCKSTLNIRITKSHLSSIAINHPYKLGKESENIYFNLKVLYPFVSLVINEIGLEGIKNLQLFEQKLKEILAIKYNILFKNIKLKLANRNISKKGSIYSMCLISQITKTEYPRSNAILMPGKYETFTIKKKRIVTKYANTDAGDEAKQKDKEICKILKKIEIHKSAKAYNKNWNWISNAAIHSNVNLKTGFLFKTDVNNFFESMNIDLLNKIIIKELNYSEDIKIIKEENIKQGLILPPLLSNIYMKQFDKNVFDYCREKHLVYSRYSDDITISTTNKTSNIFKVKEIEIFLKNEIDKVLLTLNKDKTFIFDKNFKKDYVNVTGILFTRDGLKISKRHSDKLNAWDRNPIKYGLTKKYVKNYKNQLKKYKIKM